MPDRSVRVAAAMALALVVLVVRSVAPSPTDGWLFLLIAPIALIAIDFSFAGGLISAVLASLVVLAFKFLGGIDYTLTGVGVRIAAFLIAGAGVGYLVEERRKREEALHDLRRRETEHQEALRLNDEVVQGLAVAKMALEMGNGGKAQVTLETTLKRARQLASRRLTGDDALTQSPQLPPSN